MKSNTYHTIDATKAALFIMLSLALVTVMIMWFFIPDIKNLKIAHMAQEHAEIAMRQSMAELKMQQAKLQNVQEEHSRALQMLQAPFEADRFHNDAVSHFAHFEISPVQSRTQDRFLIDEYNITAELREPGDFYGFINFLNSYQNAVEVAFPIHIHADERFLLNWRFGLQVYRIQPDQARP